MHMRRQLCVPLDAAIFRVLTQSALAEGCSVSAIVRRIVRARVHSRPQPNLPPMPVIVSRFRRSRHHNDRLLHAWIDESDLQALYAMAQERDDSLALCMRRLASD
jgi:hypothetical protein